MCRRVSESPLLNEVLQSTSIANDPNSKFPKAIRYVIETHWHIRACVISIISSFSLPGRWDEHTGKGFIGVEVFRLLMNDRRFRGLPMCLETPKGPDLNEDREKLTLLGSLIET